MTPVRCNVESRRQTKPRGASVPVAWPIYRGLPVFRGVWQASTRIGPTGKGSGALPVIDFKRNSQNSGWFRGPPNEWKASGGAQAAISRPDSVARGGALIKARFDFPHEFNDRQPCDASSPVTAYVPEGAACFA